MDANDLKMLGTAMKAQPLQTFETDGDLISRQAAIDLATFYETWPDPFPRLLDNLKALPSAQPEIIYCKDCIKWAKTLNAAICAKHLTQTKSDDFCSYGKRREDG